MHDLEQGLCKLAGQIAVQTGDQELVDKVMALANLSHDYVPEKESEMSAVIWKVVLEKTHEQTIEVPMYAKLLSVGVQKGRIVLWYHCNPEMGMVTRRIVVCNTGEPIPTPTENYAGSVTIPGTSERGLHVFELA